jgi:hypothetical protein
MFTNFYLIHLSKKRGVLYSMWAVKVTNKQGFIRMISTKKVLHLTLSAIFIKPTQIAMSGHCRKGKISKVQKARNETWLYSTFIA